MIRTCRQPVLRGKSPAPGMEANRPTKKKTAAFRRRTTDSALQKLRPRRIEAHTKLAEARLEVKVLAPLAFLAQSERPVRDDLLVRFGTQEGEEVPSILISSLGGSESGQPGVP